MVEVRSVATDSPPWPTGRDHAPEGLHEFLARDPERVGCPFGMYASLRETAPVWAPEISALVVSRYRDIVTVLRDSASFSSEHASGSGGATLVARRLLEDPRTTASVRAAAQRRVDLARSPVLLHADPPRHGRQRGLVNKAFTPRRVAALRPSIEAAAHEILDESADRELIAFVEDFAAPLPIRVIGDFLGIDNALRADFKRWSDALVAGIGTTLDHTGASAILADVEEFYRYFEHEIADRRANPRDDFLTDLVTVGDTDGDGGQSLSPDELLQMLVQFLVAGNETTTMLITAVVDQLARDDALRAAVTGGHTPLSDVVDEVLRLESPVQGMFRTATVDTEIGGTAVPAGTQVFLLYGSGNRDDDQFPDPDRFDAGRRNLKSTLSFGHGPHFCLGAPLARTETEIAVTAFLDRTEHFTTVPGDRTYIGSYIVRGLQQLPLHVRWTSS